MSFVDFNLSTELSEEQPTCFTVEAYFCRGDYGAEIDPFTKESRIVYKRTERWKEVVLQFMPNTTRDEVMKNLYDLLLEEKQPNDEVIPECLF